MNPQRVELVPHSALSARFRWTKFLLQSLRRPLGYTECPHLNPDSLVAEHNASKVTSQQRRGFRPTCYMHRKQMRATKGNESPKGRTCPSQCSKCPFPMDQIPLAVAAAPPGVHRMPSLEPKLPSGTAQRFKCHQSAALRFSSTNWMQKGRRGSPRTSNLSLTVLRVPVSDGPDSSCSGCGAP